MTLLIQNAEIIAPGSSLHGSTQCILIEKGKISKIASKITPEKNWQLIQSSQLKVSAGWMDMQANFRDPGLEHKEDLTSGCLAAAQGGFTAVAVMPGTQPPVYTKAQVEYIKNATQSNIVDVYPVGSITHKQDGKDLAEMYDMQRSGAIAFSDDKKPLMDAGTVMRALQYSANINALLICHCDDNSISHGGKMNEGHTSTLLGLKGIPALAEELMVHRNLSILEYTGGKIHFPTISTKGSVELIKKAKAKGLAVSAGTAAHYLLLDDSRLMEFDTHYKVNPPLRSREDVEALKKAVLSGVIDTIVSDHAPEDIENKDIEFDLAADGIIGLETCFAVANTAFSGSALEALIEKLSIQPRRILGIPVPEISEGAEANLTIFDPELSWTVERKHLRSKSANTPFLGQTLKGKVLAIVNNKQHYLCR